MKIIVEKIRSRVRERILAKKLLSMVVLVVAMCLLTPSLLSHVAASSPTSWTENYTNNSNLDVITSTSSSSSVGAILTFQDAGGGVTPSGSNGNNCTPLSPTYNCTWNGIAIAGEAASGIGIYQAKGTSDVILRAPSFNIPDQGQGTTSVTFSGDYLLDGYIHIEGSVAGVGAFYPDAYITTTLSVVGSPSNTNPQTYTDQLDHVELSQSDCSSTTVNGVGNCWRGIGFSSDKTFSYTQLLSPGFYYLSLTFETHAETTVSGAAGSTAMACFSPSINSYCMDGSWCSCTDVPPPSTQPASCPSGLSGNQCYYTQWKYTTYNVASPDFTVSVNPSTLFLYPGGMSGQEYITVQSVNGWSPAVTDSCTQTPANVVMWMGNGPENGPQTVPTGFSFSWQNPNNVCNGLENIQVPSNGAASATLNLAAAANTVPGTYSFYVTVDGPAQFCLCLPPWPRAPQHFVLVTVVVFDPDFAISVNPSAVAAPSGTSGTYTVTVSPVNGFAGTVSLAYSASPAGPTCTLNLSTITLGSQQTSSLSCNSTAAQNYSLKVTGTSGSLSHSAGPLTFQVTDFGISAASLTTNVGQTGTSTVTLTSLNGFAGQITLTDNVPAGLTCNPLNPSAAILPPSPSSASLSCSSTTPGSYPVAVTGTIGALTHSTTATFTVPTPDFSIASNPTSLTANRGWTATSNIYVTALSGFSGTVNLAISRTPSTGTMNCALNQYSVTGSGNLVLSCYGDPGIYTVTVTGTSGTLSHSTTVTYTIQYFNIAANPTSLTVIGGGASTVTISPLNGFSANAALTWTVTNSPPNFSCSLSPTTITGSGTSTLYCNGAAGNYVVTVTGTSGGSSPSMCCYISNQVSVSFAVKDFAIAANPSTINIPDGRISAVTVTATSLNGYTGTISLSFYGPYCATYNFSPTTIQLSAGGTGTATLSLSIAQNCLAQAHSSTVIGYDNTALVNRAATITITTSDFYLSAPISTFGIAGKHTLPYNVTYYNENNYPSTSIAQSLSFGPNNCCFGATYTLSVSLQQGSVTSVIYISSTGATGSTTLTISATDNHITRSVTLYLTANDYNVTLYYNPLSVTKGSSTAIYFQVFPYFFIPLTSATIVPTTVPSCLTLGTPNPQYFNLGPVTPYSFITLPVSAASTCNTGNYQVTATITGVNKPITFTVTVVPPPPGGGGGGGSVAAGTLITLADGSQVPVQSLKVGMQLLSYNMTTHKYVITTITKFVAVMTYNQMVIGTSTGKPLIVDQNPAQKLYVMLPDCTVTLMSVTDLKVGHSLFDAMSQTWIPITSIHYENGGHHLMYDIYTTSPGNYIANGYLDPLKM